MRRRLPNSPELVRSAQTELIRLGCFTGKSRRHANAPTRPRSSRYLKIGGQPADNLSVTKDLVAELAKHTTRVCPIECKSGETPEGRNLHRRREGEPAPAPATASRKNDDDEDNARARKKQQANRDRDQDQPRRQKQVQQPEAPHVRQQAVARPSIVSGGGGGGGGGGSHTMIGVGF